ncbi:MAG TPA: hypothetical protein DCS63_01205 [Elusimicrobia bacterium]|nr:hypothetical protein [Elusimicrobiota bacterium]
MIRTERNTRKLVYAMAGLFVFGLAASLYFNIRHINEHYLQLALGAGRSVFQSTVEARRWNATHGGVYVPVTAKTLPNPYLKDPLRDVVTKDGLKLTKINPAYMTRLISEQMSVERGVKMRITSLNPISPRNLPDKWEAKALGEFSAGAKEIFVVVGGKENIFRYMAPLITEKSCLKCHAVQGYKEGDIRGGISVDIPYSPFLAVMRQHVMELVLTHLAFLALGLIVIGVLGWAIFSNVRELAETLRLVKTLEGILPICLGCKKIRADGANPGEPVAWIPLESYISGKTTASFSHGLCPECAKRIYPQYSE